MILFGSGELIVLKQNIIIVLAQNDIIWRFLFAYAFAVLSMGVVTALSFLFSALVENAIGPIITTMTIIIIFMIISAINIDIFQSIKPYLFTNYFGAWKIFFDKPVDIPEIIKAILILLAQLLGLFALAAYIFQKKDILT